MDPTGDAGDGKSKKCKSDRGDDKPSAKHTCLSDQQVEIFEKIYAKCQNPTGPQMLQMVKDNPLLKDVSIEQITVWFRSRREKQHQEDLELQGVNSLVTAKNKELREEHEHLQDTVKMLEFAKVCLLLQLRNEASASTKLESESTTKYPELSSSINDEKMSLLLLAEEIMDEFLLKTTGSAFEWLPVPGIKPVSDSTGNVYVSHNCAGVAARACAVVPLGPLKIMDILKDRTSWFWDCRNHEVVAKFPARNGGTIELVYMQFYAPTTLASARDFWTLRYTKASEDNSVMVCERSLSRSSVSINPPSSLEFARAKMLASGYLIRPFEGGGSTINIIYHLDLKASSVPYELQPLYKSPEFLAQKMTVSALGYIDLIAKEANEIMPHTYGHVSAIRSFRQRLSRGLNDAINSFTEDGWLEMDSGVSNNLVVTIKQSRNLGIKSNSDGILCVKSSILLQSVSPTSLIRLLRNRRADWADTDDASALYPIFSTRHLTGSNVRFGNTTNEDEKLEMVRLKSHTFSWENHSGGSLYLVQICNGMGDNDICSEMILAPVDVTLPPDDTLLTSGFRILSLGLETVNGYAESRSMLVTAFQFPFERNRYDEVAIMAQKYVHHVISSVLKIAEEAAPSGSKPAWGMKAVPDINPAVKLANLICQSYRWNIGCELLHSTSSNGSFLEPLWRHQDAVLCWCFQETMPSISICMFANNAGLEMLETNLDSFHELALDKIVDKSGQATLSSIVPDVMQQGHAVLSAGICLSTEARAVSYEQAVAWKVPKGEGPMRCIAVAFSNWSFD